MRFVGRVLLPMIAMMCAIVLGAASVPEASASRLRFGIYANDGVGPVNPIGATLPQNERARWDALAQLRSSRARPFVLHLYTSWDGRTPFRVARCPGRR
jgi:hypothetical protein